MKKTLQILVGLFLILLLAYFAFLDISEKRKNDLLSKSETIDKNTNSMENVIKETSVKIEDKEENITQASVTIIDKNSTLTKSVVKKQEVNITKTLTQSKEETHSVEKHVIIITATPPQISKTPTNLEIVKPSSETTIIPTPMKSSVNIPTVVTVPKPIQKIVDVPTPVKAITPPIAVETEKAIEFKTKGVEE